MKARVQFCSLLALLGIAFSTTEAAPSRPNIVLILADDLGFSDIGCYGSEIRTPHLDRLAAEGLRFTQFYNAARCCPSRAALLTGLYPHQAHVGDMVDEFARRVREQLNSPAYSDRLNPHAPTMAEALRAAGYRTGMSGKWHLGYRTNEWPVARGFDRSFTVIEGAMNYYGFGMQHTGVITNPPMALDSAVFLPPREGFYATDAFTDFAVRFIDESATNAKPFFLYLAYTAPHWPLHAKPENIARCVGHPGQCQTVARRHRLPRKAGPPVPGKKKKGGGKKAVRKQQAAMMLEGPPKPMNFTHTIMPTARVTVARGASITSLACLMFLAGNQAAVTAESGQISVRVADGIVQPRRPLTEAIADAMLFLKRADGAYVPGRMEGELAGYFTSAHVNPDGTRSNRKVSFPARQHAYFIFTFLRYYAYTGEREWLQRARDLADWNLAHSTPQNAVYSEVPYSTFFDGKPGGSRDGDAIEPDKSAFLGSGYIAIYEATGDRKYLDAAATVARTLAKQQREDGSWPFRVVPETGVIRQDFGGAPVFFVEFFEALLRYQNQPEWKRAHEQALKLMLTRNVEKKLWGTYHEDIVSKPEAYLSAESVSFTADYLFRKAVAHPAYLDMGRKIIRTMEARLVYTNGHAAAPAPAVSEQAGFEHLMPGHTARYCRVLADWYAITGDEDLKRHALSGFNAVTYMQSPPGLFRTFFASVNPKADTSKRPNWYSQHLYTVCHILEAMSVLPELAPVGQDHLLVGDVFIREVRYAPGEVSFQTLAPSKSVIKLSFTPQTVLFDKRELPSLDPLSAHKKIGWHFDAVAQLLTIRHAAGPISVGGAAAK